MSIYPVPLAEWFGPDDELHEVMTICVKYAECEHCGDKKMDWKEAWGHHAIPWGHGDIWCNKSCLEGKKNKSKGRKL